MNNTRISQLAHENTAKGRRNIVRPRPAHTEVFCVKTICHCCGTVCRCDSHQGSETLHLIKWFNYFFNLSILTPPFKVRRTIDNTDKDSKYIPENEQAFLIVPLCVMNNKIWNVKL